MTGPLSRFLRYTTQDEPVITAGVIAAFVLYLLDRYLGLTEDDLQLLGLLLVPIVTAIGARLQAWSPASVDKAITKAAGDAYQDGLADGQHPPKP